MNKKVLLNDLNLWQENGKSYLSSDLPRYSGGIGNQKTDILSQVSYDFEVVEVEKWGIYRFGSNFYGQNIYENKITCINSSGVTTWEGQLQSVKRNYTDNTAVLTAQAVFNLLLAKTIEYNNIGVTPARVVIDLLERNGLFSYAGDSLVYADNLLKANGITFNYRFEAKNKTTHSDAINKLSKVACADIFIDTNNKLQMIVWDKSQTSYIPVVILKKRDLLSPLIIVDTIKDIINNYKIKIGAIDLTDSVLGNVGAASRKQYNDLSFEYIDLSPTQEISTNSQAVAQLIGESYISRWGQPAIYIDTEIDNTNFSGILQLGQFVAFDSTVNYENLVGMVFQIIKLVENNDRYWGITLKRVS